MSGHTNIDGAALRILGGAVLAIVGAFLPWVSGGIRAGPADISLSVAGVGSMLGMFTLVAAVFAIGITLAFNQSRRTFAGISIAGLFVLLIGLMKFIDLNGFAGAGVGLYVSILGGLAMTAAGIFEYRGASSGEA